MKIVLIGYMGSGKSTVGKALANSLSSNFVDLDNYIEKAEGQSIPEIFKQQGEIRFRKLEHKYLNEVLLKTENLVLATGGGTPCYSNNMETILENTDKSVYLKLSIASLLIRLQNEMHKRPLIKNIATEELPEFIGKHLFERSFYYNQANYTVNCDGKSPAKIVIEFESLLV